jgi:NADH:ubiquinone reductase (H+-translocating)
MLSEAAIGMVDPRHIVNPIRELCRKTTFHRAEVINIDLKHQNVDILYNSVQFCPDTLHYDHLVLALGSTSNVMLVPGVDRFAFNFKELGDALILRNHILEMFERADTAENQAQKRSMLTFSIIGGGYSGVEVAAAIQDMAHRIVPLYPTINREDVRVMVVEAGPRLLSTMPRELSDYAQQVMSERGIEIRLNTRLTEVHPRWVSFNGNARLDTYTAVWATGIMPSPLLRPLPIAKDNRGRPLGTEQLRLAGFDNVWGIGDNILTPIPDKAGFYPATAQIAVRQGRHLAENIYRVIQGKEPKPFKYDQKGEMVVLGERSAVALIYGRKMRGFWAWVLWRMFYLSRLPTWKKKFRVATDWLLSLFGPMETTQLKVYFRQEPCDVEDMECERRNVPEQRYGF